jgi:HlyD family secretion protein
MAEVITGIQDDEYIQILSGIEVDEEVVTGPYSAVSKKLKEGKTVRIKEDKKKDKDEDED